MGKKTLLEHFYIDFYRFSKISDFVYVKWGRGVLTPNPFRDYYMVPLLEFRFVENRVCHEYIFSGHPLIQWTTILSPKFGLKYWIYIIPFLSYQLSIYYALNFKIVNLQQLNIVEKLAPTFLVLSLICV